MPQADEGKTRIQPILHLKRYRGLYTCLLLIIKIECLVDFNQTFGGLVECLYRVVLGVVEPSAEDVFAFQNIGHFQLILLCRFQQRITMQLRVSAADVRDGILHRPVVGIVLVAAQRELKDMSRCRHIVQVDNGIPVPLVPDGSLVMLHSQRSVQSKFVAETLAETCIDIPGLLAAADFILLKASDEVSCSPVSGS